MAKRTVYLLAATVSAAVLLAVVLLAGPWFGGERQETAQDDAAPQAARPDDQGGEVETWSREVVQGSEAELLPDEPDEDLLLAHALETWTGDLDGMLDRGFVRVLTVHNPIFFTYDGVEQKGLVVDVARAFETHLLKLTKRKAGSFDVVIIPVARDDLLPFLLAGKGDLVDANLTITTAREGLVAFSDPTYPQVDELVVTGPAAPPLETLDDLADTEVHLRPSSSYFEHLSALNRGRSRAGQAEIPVVSADERLEDYDLLEMVNAGLIPAIIVDSHKAALWAQVFQDITVREDLAVHRGGQIAWAFRKDSPKLREAVNSFVKTARKGTLLGNILLDRYLRNPQWIDNVRTGRAWERYEETVGLIREYAARYEFDWLMITAQGYQESKLDQSKRSHAGAVGVMQVLPSTAADPKIDIQDIELTGPNIHAGVKYLRFVKDRYFDDPAIAPLDQMLFAFAAYNAGPRAIARARRKAERMGLDPNRWFGNVEVAAARTISREPVVYVRNIYKYYVAYGQVAALTQGAAMGPRAPAPD